MQQQNGLPPEPGQVLETFVWRSPHATSNLL